MERQAKETLLRFPYIPKKEARTVAWSNLKFISHLYLQSCKLLEHLCYTAQENYLNKAVQTHVWNVCRQTNRMSVIPFPSALWSWIHVTRSYHFRLLMLCPVHLNPPETEILQVLLNADCCNALSSGQESQESTFTCRGEVWIQTSAGSLFFHLPGRPGLHQDQIPCQK
ncbi:uncharacterized protein [Aphelocoma coerulescens]|uniref:uncharacterized protein isoform X6 n=1 Tax=Aphelocoma coerulescens TaxID=39617 RepID=UPI003604482F